MATLRLPSIVFGGHAAPRQLATQLVQPPDIDTRATPRTALSESAVSSAMLFRFPQRKGVMPEQARAFADSNPWMRASINRIKDRVARAERQVIAIDPERPFSTDVQRRIAYLIENPNPRGDSWRSFIEPVIEDVCVLGKGGWEYVPNWRGWPVALYPYNAQFMAIDSLWDGSNPKQARYYWTPLPRQSIPLRNDEATMIILNPRTDRPEGLGWVDTLKDTLEADSAGNEYVRSMLKRYPPPGWFHLGPDAGKRQVDAVSQKLNTDVLGRGGMLVTGGLDNISFTNLQAGSSRDHQLIEWQNHFGMIVAAVAGISPQDIGLTMDVNKSTSESQERLSAEGGYRSMLLLMQEYINREIVGKFGVPETINLKFVFKELAAKDRMQQITIANAMAGGVPIALYNEARAEADLPPLELGNAVYVKTLDGAVAILGNDMMAYHRQKQAQIADTQDQEAQDKQQPDGNESATPQKDTTPADSGAATQEQDGTAANQTPKGTAKASYTTRAATGGRVSAQPDPNDLHNVRAAYDEWSADDQGALWDAAQQQ